MDRLNFYSLNENEIFNICSEFINRTEKKTLPNLIMMLGLPAARDYFDVIKNSTDYSKEVRDFLKCCYTSIVKFLEDSILQPDNRSLVNAFLSMRTRMQRYGWGDELDTPDNTPIEAQEHLVRFVVVKKVDGKIVEEGTEIDLNLSSVKQETITTKNNLIDNPVTNIKDAAEAFRRAAIQADRDCSFDSTISTMEK